jgi:predicted TIM-barrel fold metal-dependent hydrolase
MSTEHEAWLALASETPLMPDLPICDPHHHFWERPGGRYLLEELLADVQGGHNVTHTVFVECSSGYYVEGPAELRPVGETLFVESTIAPTVGGPISVAAGIVGHVNLTLGTRVAAVLEAHLAASPTRFRGIRHVASWDASAAIRFYMNPPQGLLLDTRYREGLACLQRYGLSYDTQVSHTQLPELLDLARTFPGVTMIVDHAGCPLNVGPYAGQREAVFQVWKRSMADLATCPNVTVKLGGMAMVVKGPGWSERSAPPSSVELAEVMAPYYLWCIEKFGVGRCMFESNFPVDQSYASYTVLWNAFKRVAQGFSPQEKAALLHDTAARVYRL